MIIPLGFPLKIIIVTDSNNRPIKLDTDICDLDKEVLTAINLFDGVIGTVDFTSTTITCHPRYLANLIICP